MVEPRRLSSTEGRLSRTRQCPPRSSRIGIRGVDSARSATPCSVHPPSSSAGNITRWTVRRRPRFPCHRPWSDPAHWPASWLPPQPAVPPARRAVPAAHRPRQPADRVWVQVRREPETREQPESRRRRRLDPRW